MKSQYSMCCGTPLSSALVFRGAELYCVRCGNSYGMFGAPSRREATPELDAEYERNRALYIPLAKQCIGGGMRLRDCEKCSEGEYHIQHATPEERAASDAAYERLYAGNLENLTTDETE